MRQKNTAQRVKCAYCGRERIPVTKKGYMKPHVKPDGRPCLFILIPNNKGAGL